MTDVLERRWPHDGHRDAGREQSEDGGRDWSDVSASWEMPSKAHHHQKLGEKHEIDFPLNPQKGLTLMTSSFWPSSLQNCERKKFCGFRLPSLWWFVMTALGNEYSIIMGRLLKDHEFIKHQETEVFNIHFNPISHVMLESSSLALSLSSLGACIWTPPVTRNSLPLLTTQ